MTRHDTGPHLELVRFERIFDAPGGTGMFSFEADGRCEYGVRLFDGAVPHAGARYAVVLAEAGNWQTIVGWRDLSMPDVVLRDTVLQAALRQAWLAYLGVPALLAIALLTARLWPPLVVLALMLSASVTCLYRVRRRGRMIAALLRDVPRTT